jgi:hypothetical protein
VIGDVEVDEQAAVVAENDEGEQQAEGEGRDHEEVDRDELSGVRGEEGAPRGRRPRRRPAHVLGDGLLGDLVAEQDEFCLDASAIPRRILPRQASREAWSATGALEDEELMAEREVLEGDGRRAEEQGAEEGPDTDHE